MKKTLVLYVDMPCEKYSVVVYRLLNENCETHEFKIGDCTKPDKTIEIIDKVNPDNIIMFGTYWKPCLKELLDKYENINFIVSLGRQKINIESKNLNQEFIVTLPTHFIFEVLEITGKTANENFIKMLKNSNKEVFDIIDDRFLSKNVKETQIFFSGLYNISPIESNISFEKAFENIILNERGYSFKEVMEIGKIISDSQFKMALERAKKNSKIITVEFKGKKYKMAIVNAPDLINVTHEAVLEHYREEGIDITCIINIKLENKNEYVAYSYRTSNKDVDLNDFLDHLPDFGCDPKDSDFKSGGGRKPINVVEMFFKSE